MQRDAQYARRMKGCPVGHLVTVENTQSATPLASCATANGAQRRRGARCCCASTAASAHSTRPPAGSFRLACWCGRVRVASTSSSIRLPSRPRRPRSRRARGAVHALNTASASSGDRRSRLVETSVGGRHLRSPRARAAAPTRKLVLPHSSLGRRVAHHLQEGQGDSFGIPHSPGRGSRRVAARTTRRLPLHGARPRRVVARKLDAARLSKRRGAWPAVAPRRTPSSADARCLWSPHCLDSRPKLRTAASEHRPHRHIGYCRRSPSPARSRCAADQSVAPDGEGAGRTPRLAAPKTSRLAPGEAFAACTSGRRPCAFASSSPTSIRKYPGEGRNCAETAASSEARGRRRGPASTGHRIRLRPRAGRQRRHDGVDACVAASCAVMARSVSIAVPRPRPSRFAE
jgi:hypothetical protein